MSKRVKFNDDHDHSAMPGTDPAFIQGFIDGKREGRGLNEGKPTRNRTPHYDSGFSLGYNVGANDKMLREQKIKDAIEAADRGDPVNGYSQFKLTEEEYRKGQKRLLEKEDLLESYGGKKRRKSKRRKSSKSKKSRRRRQNK